MAKQQQIEQVRPVTPSQASEIAAVQGTPAETTQDTIDDIKKALGQNVVIYGDLKNPFDLAGVTVADVRRDLADAWSIDDEAVAHLNGEKVSEDTVIQRFQEVEFRKNMGVKGATCYI